MALVRRLARRFPPINHVLRLGRAHHDSRLPTANSIDDTLLATADRIVAVCDTLAREITHLNGENGPGDVDDQIVRACRDLATVSGEVCSLVKSVVELVTHVQTLPLAPHHGDGTAIHGSAGHVRSAAPSEPNERTDSLTLLAAAVLTFETAAHQRCDALIGEHDAQSSAYLQREILLYRAEQHGDPVRIDDAATDRECARAELVTTDRRIRLESLYLCVARLCQARDLLRQVRRHRLPPLR